MNFKGLSKSIKRSIILLLFKFLNAIISFVTQLETYKELFLSVPTEIKNSLVLENLICDIPTL